jgi:hypothetical protein
MVFYGRRAVAEQLKHESDLSLLSKLKFRIHGVLPPRQLEFYAIVFKKGGILFCMKCRL